MFLNIPFWHALKNANNVHDKRLRLHPYLHNKHEQNNEKHFVPIFLIPNQTSKGKKLAILKCYKMISK